MKTKTLILPFLTLGLCLSSCGNNQLLGGGSSTSKIQTSESETITKLKLSINDYDFDVSIVDNNATKKLIEIIKENLLIINLKDYGGFEKVGPIRQDLPSNDTRISTHPGDIVLYQGNQIVMFYGSNTWSYTMLGHVDNLTNWEKALGKGDISAVFSLF